jgi:glucose-1-phosphate thymidylyltransferase
VFFVYFVVCLPLTSKDAMEKAVILARGLGTRMRRADEAAPLDARQAAVAQSGVKALMPIDRPFLDYVLTGLAEAGYRRVCLVVAPDHEAIRRYYQEQAPPRRLAIELAVQPEPRGTADAVAAAEPFAGGDPFLVVNSDTYYPQEALCGLRDQPGAAVALFEMESMLASSNIAPERVRQFALAQIDAEGRLARILEKPTEADVAALPRPLWLSMNCWRLVPSIFEACRRISPSVRGELELPDAVQYAIDRLGEPFTVVPVRAAVLDLTSRRDVASIAARLKGTKVEY